MTPATRFDPTPRTKVRRRAGRANYERAAVEAILDAGLVGHVGICGADGQPYVMPMIYGRVADTVFLHGSPRSRLLSALGGGARVCLTVTLIDGIVFARSAFHHSVNYRSVVVLGEARRVTDEAERHAALRAIVDHIAGGRSHDVRGPSEQELAATAVVAVPLSEASAKVRVGPPQDAAEDYALPTWAGVVPLRLAAGAPITDARCDASVPLYASEYTRDDLPGAA